MRNDRKGGFALVELLTALFIVCILVIALTTIYSGSVDAISSINTRLEKGDESSEIVWLIMDDITKASSADTDTSFTLNSKVSDGVTLYRLEIVSKIYDNAGKELVYQKVIWQSDYDFYTGTISLYRCLGGMIPADPVLSTEAKENPDTDIFVPVCQGLTYFTLQVPKVQSTPQGDVIEYLNQWDNDEMPGGVVVDLSFEPPVEYVTGEVEVPLEDRVVESIALNRSKQYRFQFISKDLDAAYGQDEEQLDEDGEQSDEEMAADDQSGDSETVEEETTE